MYRVSTFLLILFLLAPFTAEADSAHSEAALIVIIFFVIGGIAFAAIGGAVSYLLLLKTAEQEKKLEGKAGKLKVITYIFLFLYFIVLLSFIGFISQFF